MRLSKSRLLLMLLVVVGIPTTGYGLYAKYIEIASETVVSGADAIELYKECMMVRANTLARRPQEAKAFLDDMEKKLPDAVKAASKLAAVNAVADKSVSSTNIATELPKCAADLKRELAEPEE